MLIWRNWFADLECVQQFLTWIPPTHSRAMDVLRHNDVMRANSRKLTTVKGNPRRLQPITHSRSQQHRLEEMARSSFEGSMLFNPPIGGTAMLPSLQDSFGVGGQGLALPSIGVHDAFNSQESIANTERSDAKKKRGRLSKVSLDLLYVFTLP